jgi:FkbH-like protein
MTELRRLISEARFEEAWRQLLLEARTASDYPAFLALGRVRRKLLTRHPPPPQPANARIALLSGATTSLLEEPLQLALESIGVGCTIHASPYNSFAREMLDAASETVAFRPDVAVLVTAPASVPSWPSWSASQEDIDAAIDQACDYWIGLCRSLHEHATCDIVLPNFHPLAVRPLGTFGAKTAGEPNRFLRGVNDALARRVPSYVHIHDVESLASFYGVSHWFDQRFWNHAKQPVSFECLVPYVRNVAQLIGALLGRSAKCVVVDLDNTLWGGNVGDDGPERLVLGEGHPEGEAFSAFQRYLLTLKERGVMLAVCSKNEERDALAPFASRPEMVLQRSDFLAFYANWQPKSENLREIAASLNIGLDALVFVDDNAAEREEVRQALPDVRVVELSADPSDYPVLLDRTGWLDLVGLSTEDQARTGMYRANVAREEIKTAAGSYDAYLKSLEQRAVVGPFEERHLDRIMQLTNKTNQFNLTTRRMTRSELAAIMASPIHLTDYVQLADRFGDNGLISVFAARGDGPDLWIELWLMSCRVFGRGVERLVCNRMVARAKEAGYRTLHGVYRPTGKNVVVKELCQTLGFARGGPIEDGDHWALELDAFQPFETAITVVKDYSPERKGSGDGRAAGVGPSRDGDASDVRRRNHPSHA